MSIPEKMRSVSGMLDRWEHDLRRLEKLFGPYESGDYSNGVEMQRNLGTAIQYARFFIATFEPRPASDHPSTREQE